MGLAIKYMMMVERKYAVAGCLLFVLLFLTSAAGGFARDVNVKVRNITMSDGLPTNTVRCIVQDKQGFIWFGTDNGLCRYDGYGVQTFTIPQNKFDQFVSALSVTDDGLLVGTSQGAYAFTFRTEQFELLSNKITSQVSSFSRDADNNVWISTMGKGIYRYNLHSKVCKNFPFSMWRGKVALTYADANNQVWALGNTMHSPVYRLNKSTDKFDVFPLKSSLSLSSMSMLQTDDNNLLIGTWDNGLVKLNGDGTVEQLINPVTSNHAHHIHSLCKKSATEVLVGSDDGLLLYDLQQKKWRVLSELDDSKHFASERFVYSITRDSEGGLWIGTFYGGVNYVSPMGERFHTYTHDDAAFGLSGNVVGRFCEDAQHRIWIATDDGGVNCYDAANDRFVNYPGKQVLGQYNVHGLYVDGGELWAGTYGNGVVRMNLTSGALKTYHLDGRRFSSSCYCIFRDSKHRLWATSMDGVNVFDEQSGQFRVVKSFKSLTIDIFEDTGGNVWFSTQGKGLWRLSGKSSSLLRQPEGAWKHYVDNEEESSSIPDNQVNCVRQDAQGRIFVATDQGLCEYNPDKDNFQTVRLLDNAESINSIIINQDEMWLSSNMGLIRCISGEKTRVYNHYDGLTCDQFVANSSLLASDGRIYFGTTRGFNAFYPYQIKVNQTTPPVFITSLELYNRHVKVGSEKLPESLGQIDQLDLAYGDDMFSISFAALSYISPEKNQYAYMLEGFDKEWIYSGSEHKATYTNIPAGTYTFRVKATNNDGVWSSQEAQLKIVVHPPFWWGLPAKLLYLLLICYAVYLYSQLRVRREKRRHQQELQQLSDRKEQEVRDARLQFFTMIAHEIRTPVSLIIGPLENLKSEWAKLTLPAKESKAMNATIDVIDRNAQRLLNLVNQLLDFNKVQQNAMQVHFKLQNISKLMRAVAERFEPTLQKNGAHLEVDYPSDDFAAVIDNEAITKVISNLMTNASKYTKDYVRLTCKVIDKEHFCIEVCDNGEGVSADEQEKIFSAFYQAKDNKPGTGIGLSIVKNLVTAHHGKVEVVSKVGMGATFIVTLPVHQQDVAVGEDDAASDLNRQVVDADSFEKEKTVENAEQEDKETPEKPSMLVVEDDDDMRQFIAANFSDVYQVYTAENGVEGLKQLASHTVTLIVSDWMMPEMDGAEFCRRVRQNPQTSHVPFVMLTAKTDDGSKTESMNCGADAYIEKPFSMKYLEACIRNLIEMRHLLQSKYSHTPLEPITEVASNSVDNEFLVKMNQLIEDNITNPCLSVVFLAEQMNISRSSLFAKIKALVDVTPNELIQLVKLKKAATLLKSGNHRISEVCYMVGFSSPSYFSKCFQKQFGMRPGEFVEQNASTTDKKVALDDLLKDA